jgi:hypothetical protein
MDTTAASNLDVQLPGKAQPNSSSLAPANGKGVKEKPVKQRKGGKVEPKPKPKTEKDANNAAAGYLYQHVVTACLLVNLLFSSNDGDFVVEESVDDVVECYHSAKGDALFRFHQLKHKKVTEPLAISDQSQLGKHFRPYLKKALRNETLPEHLQPKGESLTYDFLVREKRMRVLFWYQGATAQPYLGALKWQLTWCDPDSVPSKGPLIKWVPSSKLFSLELSERVGNLLTDRERTKLANTIHPPDPNRISQDDPNGINQDDLPTRKQKAVRSFLNLQSVIIDGINYDDMQARAAQNLKTYLVKTGIAAKCKLEVSDELCQALYVALFVDHLRKILKSSAADMGEAYSIENGQKRRKWTSSDVKAKVAKLLKTKWFCSNTSRVKEIFMGADALSYCNDSKEKWQVMLDNLNSDPVQQAKQIAVAAGTILWDYQRYKKNRDKDPAEEVGTSHIQVEIPPHAPPQLRKVLREAANAAIAAELAKGDLSDDISRELPARMINKRRQAKKRRPSVSEDECAEDDVIEPPHKKTKN